MNWKGIALFFILLAVSFSLSWGHFSQSIITPAYPLERERVQIGGTDFTMRILKEFNFYQDEDEDNPSTHISPPYFSSYLPRFEVYPVKLGWVYTKVFIDPEKFGTSAYDPNKYTDLKVYNLDGMRVLIAKTKNVERNYDFVVRAWVIFEDQYLAAYGWGPVARADDIYRMFETMLVTLQVESDE
jgi:hypothetical protein